MAQPIEIDVRRVAEFALSKLKLLSVDAAEISVNQSRGFSVSARMQAVETSEHHLEKSFGVTVFHQKRVGTASSSDFSNDSIVATIDKAISIAHFAHPDPYAGLADKEKLAGYYPDCDLYHPWNISPADAIQLAIVCEKKALSIDSRIMHSDGVNISSGISHGVYANTADFMGFCQSSQHVINCSLIAREKNEMQRDDEYTIARNPQDLKSIDDIATRAAEKTLLRLNARRIKTQACPVIFEASVAKSVLGHFIAAISGSHLYRQSSFLLNALGKPVFPAFIDIWQEPHLLSAMGSRPFDHEGVATILQHYVRAGQLEKYVLGSYSARKLGMQTTGNAGGVFNLCISHTDVTLQQLIQKMHRGLFVTELMGQGVNITTGDYSRGAVGFWVENGEIQFPVEEITIAGNLKNMLLGIIAISNDTDIRSTIRTGSILIEQMMVAGE